MVSTTSRPFAISRRRPLAVIDPSGKASLAAMSSLSGVSGATLVESTIWAFIFASCR
jgi:hypothetical protein